MSRPRKNEIRTWARRLREDMIGANAALTTDNSHQIKLYLSDALACLDEVVGLAEERYSISIECAEAPSENPLDGPEEGESEDEGENAEEDFEDDEEDDEDEEGEEFEEDVG